jgi:hypothetical protein
MFSWKIKYNILFLYLNRIIYPFFC